MGSEIRTLLRDATSKRFCDGEKGKKYTVGKRRWITTDRGWYTCVADHRLKRLRTRAPDERARRTIRANWKDRQKRARDGERDVWAGGGYVGRRQRGRAQTWSFDTSTHLPLVEIRGKTAHGLRFAGPPLVWIRRRRKKNIARDRGKDDQPNDNEK